MNIQNEQMNKTNEIKLFYNDIKYITRSLSKDEEVLYQCMKSYFPRIGVHELSDFRTFYTQEEKKVEEVKLLFQRLIRLARRGKQRYHLNEWKTMNELNQFLETQGQISGVFKPSEFWFDKENYDKIRDLLDEVQTKAEDSAKSREHIFRMWHEDIMEPYNVRFANEYVELNEGSLKFLKTNYWKYRKHLKGLFIADESLYTDEEIKLLTEHISTMEGNDNWLFFQQRKIQDVIGKGFQGKETDFNQIRKEYDVFYTWLESLPEGHQINLENYYEFCDYILDIKVLECQKYYEKVKHFIPFIDENSYMDLSFEQVKEILDLYCYALRHLECQVGKISQNIMQETMTLEKWLKIVQKVYEKESWLDQKKEYINYYFGDIYNGIQTDWEHMRICIEETMGSFNGIPLRRLSQYGFMGITDINTEEIVDSLDLAVEKCLAGRYTIEVNEFIKVCAKLMGQKRVTAKWKETVQTYIEEKLLTSYDMEDGYLVSKDGEKVQFYHAREGEKRDIDLIADAELRYGVKKVIQVEGEITLDELTKTFMQLLGYPRRTKVLQERIERVVKALKEEGSIVRNSGGWSLIS